MPAHPFDKGGTPQPSRFGAVQTLHDLERPPKWTRVGPPQPFTAWRGLPNGHGFGPPPTLHDLERPPKWTRVGPPQPFTTWRAFPSRKLTADFLLPNSAYKMYHLHWVVGRSRGSPYFASSRQRAAPPPTLHDLEGAPKWTRVGPPQPFTTWSAFETDKGQGFDPPATLHDLERLRKWTRV